MLKGRLRQLLSLNTSQENNGIRNNVENALTHRTKIHNQYSSSGSQRGLTELSRQTLWQKKAGIIHQLMSWLIAFLYTKMTTKDGQGVVCTLWNLSPLEYDPLILIPSSFIKRIILCIVFRSKRTCTEYCYQSRPLGLLCLTGSQEISDSYTACDTETKRNLER